MSATDGSIAFFSTPGVNLRDGNSNAMNFMFLLYNKSLRNFTNFGQPVHEKSVCLKSRVHRLYFRM